MKQYLDLVRYVKDNGVQKGDRTGTGTISSFGHQLRFNLQEGFPIVTTKFTAFRLVASELLWFLRGETNIESLLEENNHIWDQWALENGDLGPIYGKQWRSWEVPSEMKVNYETDPPHCDPETVTVIDQITQVIEGIKTNPNSRRHIVSAWNVADLPDEKMSPQENVEQGQMALAPCHAFFQFYVADGKLSCQLYQRSADAGLGVPFNIASYALLTHMVAQECGLEVGDYVHTFGDLHIYNNHIEQIEEMLSREPKPLPKLWLNPEVKQTLDFTIDDIKLEGYEYHPSIKMPVAV